MLEQVHDVNSVEQVLRLFQSATHSATSIAPTFHFAGSFLSRTAFRYYGDRVYFTSLFIKIFLFFHTTRLCDFHTAIVNVPTHLPNGSLTFLHTLLALMFTYSGHR
jgi:hypothetical protein